MRLFSFIRAPISVRGENIVAVLSDFARMPDFACATDRGKRDLRKYGKSGYISQKSAPRPQKRVFGGVAGRPKEALRNKTSIRAEQCRAVDRAFMRSDAAAVKK